MNVKNNSEVSSSKFWNSCYYNNNTGWDLGMATPIFIDWCNRLEAEQKICVPGCGNGYDVLHFASQGHKVTAIDFAKEPIEKLKKESENNSLDIDAIQGDIFNLPLKLHNQFDYIIEYTCYCAIHPKMRLKYVETMYDLLKPGGELVGIFLPIDKGFNEGGPPFGIILDETIDIFLSCFKLLESTKHPLSIEPRSDKEQFIRFVK